MALSDCSLLSGSIGRQREGVWRGGPGVALPAQGAGVYGDGRLQPAEGGIGYRDGLGRGERAIERQSSF